MRISAAFPSQYLKAADLQGQTIRIKISHVAMEDIGGDQKPILYFADTEKGMVLNKTNANSIAGVHGDDTDNWHGHTIDLYEAQVDFQGKSMPAIRVKAARAQLHQTPLGRPTALPPGAIGTVVAPPQVANGFGAVKTSTAPVGTVIDDDIIPF